MQRQPLAEITFTEGFDISRQSLDSRLQGTSQKGSSNSLLLGRGYSKPFGGYDSKGNNTGSRYMCQIGNTWGGLKDIGVTLGAGSLFEDVGKSLWFIGAGQVHKEGTNLTGLIASSILQVALSVSGVYSAANTYDAGLPQPSAPDVGIPSSIGLGYTGLIDGAISSKLVRLRLSTGGASRPSTTSAVVVPDRQTVRITFPLASDGQDNWAVFFTQQGFGGVGLHYRASYNGSLDIPETSVTRPLTGLSITNASAVVNASAGTFLSTDVGKQIVLSSGNPSGDYATILSVNGTGSQATMSANATATATVTGDLNSMVDGIPRSLEFDFQDGDLQRESAEISYIDNYPPPAGTHAVRLENVMNVLGCYNDAIDTPDSTNPGTCIAVSLPNFYESYKPRHLLFLPEQVVDVLARPSDSYAWVACRNSILTLQYVGLRDAPACTIAVAFPNIGIAYPHNWVQFYGRIAMFTTKGTLVIVDEEGNLNETFASPIKKLIENFQPEDTILGFDFETNSLVVGNGDFTISYCLDNGFWSDPSYLKDSDVAGNVHACTTSEGKLIISVKDGSDVEAYDYNEGAAQMPVSKISNYHYSGSAKNIYELALSANISNTDYPLAIALQRNLRPVSVRDVQLTSGSNVVSVSEEKFDSLSVGEKVFIYGENIGGAGVHYLQGKIGVVNSTDEFQLQTLNGVALNSQANFTNGFMLIGKYIKVVDLTRTGEQHISNLFPIIKDARSFAVGCWMMTDAQSGEIINILASGTMEGASVVSVV